MCTVDRRFVIKLFKINMKTNKFDFSVTDIELEDQSIDKANIGCYITYNNEDLDCIIVDDTDHRLVLDLPTRDAVIRVTAKGLGNNARIGSVSFKASTFIDYAKKATDERWITLFDHEDDDEYDGHLDEDDPEAPRIKVSFTRGDKATKRKQGKVVKTTTTVTKTIIETTTSITEEDLRKYNVQNLRADLKNQLADLIDSLRSDQADTDAENRERVATLANLETVHAELKGENDQDEAYTKALEDLKADISNSLNQNRADIEARKQELLKTISALEDETSKSNAEKKAAQAEKDKLTKIVETPEDSKENGFTTEAKTIRKENHSLKTGADGMTSDLLKARDDRNKLIQSHSDLVNQFEDTILEFHDGLRKVAQTKRSLAFERAGLQKELEFNDLESDYLRRKIEGNGIDEKSLSDAFKRLTHEYSETDEEYNRYTDQLRLNLRNQEFILNGIIKKNNKVGDQISDADNERERQINKINYIQSELDKIQQIEYQRKFTEVNGTLREAEEQRKSHQDALEKAHADLQAKINIFADDLAARQRERDDQASKIEGALKMLQEDTATINALLKEIDALDSKRFTDANRDQVSENLNIEREAIENKLKFATDEKNKITNDLKNAISTLDDKHKYVEEQKKRIQSLKAELDKLKKLIEEKKKIIAQLENDIQQADEELERLRNDDENERLQAHADDLERRIFELEALLGDAPPPEVPDLSYKAKKGDLVDEMLAKYIQNCPVPVKRLGGGFYLFGTRKIYAKIMNGKLVIRVGGGYMVIDKFIETYAEQELTKINAILEREGLTSVDQIDLEEYCLKGNKTAYGNTKGEASPGSKNSLNASGSFRRSTTLNGTNRSPKAVKASQIVNK